MSLPLMKVSKCKWPSTIWFPLSSRALFITSTFFTADILNFFKSFKVCCFQLHAYLQFKTLPTNLLSSNLSFRSSHMSVSFTFFFFLESFPQPCCRVCVSVIKLHGTASLIALRTLCFNCLLNLTRRESLPVPLNFVCLFPKAVSKRWRNNNICMSYWVQEKWVPI